MKNQLQEDIHMLNEQSLPFIQNFLQGDSQAFQQIVHLYGHRVMRVVQKMVYSYHDAEDVYSEVWLKVAQNLHKYDQTLPFHSWLYRLTTNTCIDFLRKKKEITMEDDQLLSQINKTSTTDAETPEALFLQKEFQSMLNNLLSYLEETDRIIVTLRFSEQLTYEEIGEIVGLNKNTVGTRLFRARKQLKEMFLNNRTERRIIDVTY